MINFKIQDDVHKPNSIAVLGVPFDGNSSFLRRSALAPARIQESFYKESSNLWAENQIDLGTSEAWQFADNLNFSAGASEFVEIETTVGKLLSLKVRVISLSGDQSISYPIMSAYTKANSGLNVLQLDAQPDLYDELDSKRAKNGPQHEQAQRFGVEVHEMRNDFQLGALEFEGPVYLSLDMDCLAPAFVPGVSHHEPGGMSTRAVINLIQN